MMKIGIDARFAVHKRRGIGNYVLNLVRELALIDKENRYILYVDKTDDENVLPRQPNFRIRQLSSCYPVFEQLRLPLAAARDGLDILHCTGNTAPIFLSKNIKLVLTLHDAAYMKSLAELPLSPSLYQKLGRLYRRLVVPYAAARANAVVTVSAFAKADILSHFPALKEMSVSSLAPAEDFRVLDRELAKKTVARKYGLGGKYFLAIGGTDPQKNTAATVNAFLELKAQGKLNCGLAVVGVPDGAAGLPLVVNPSKDVVFIPFAGPQDLAQLYTAAEALVFPSLRESFGLPPLEAMACGTPVIASNGGAIPEVTGDAALLVAPSDGEALKAAMLRLAGDAELRGAMAKAGLERSKAFSWGMLATETLEIYKAAFTK
jgi:glycosyltransferase involved in cell wall biosynthesis